jgi:hypothetical protein
MSDDERRFDRAAIALGAGSLVSAAFVFGADAPTPIDFAHVGLGGAIALAAFGVLGILGGALRRIVLTFIAGAGLTLAALVQLVTLPLSPRLLGGDASAMTLLGAFGIGLLAVGIGCVSDARQPHEASASLSTARDDRKDTP